MLIVSKKIDFEILSLVLATLLLLLSCPCMGQVQQKKAFQKSNQPLLAAQLLLVMQASFQMELVHVSW